MERRWWDSSVHLLVGSYKVNPVREILWVILVQRLYRISGGLLITFPAYCGVLELTQIDRFSDKLQAEVDNRILPRISSRALNVVNLTESSPEGPNNKRSHVFHFAVWGQSKKT